MENRGHISKRGKSFPPRSFQVGLSSHSSVRDGHYEDGPLRRTGLKARRRARQVLAVSVSLAQKTPIRAFVYRRGTLQIPALLQKGYAQKRSLDEQNHRRVGIRNGLAI
jgi:hypothetical protein